MTVDFRVYLGYLVMGRSVVSKVVGGLGDGNRVFVSLENAFVF